MAAIENKTAAIVVAASALLAAVPLVAQAEGAPETATLSVKYGSYQDSQPGLSRVSASSPSVYLQTPLAQDWSLDASLVGDSVSGASPRMYDLVSSASHMTEYRKAADAKLTRHFGRAAVSASVAYSDEHDYTSKALGLQGRWSSEDNNTTWTVGHGVSVDRIDNTSNGTNTAINQRKRGREFLVGVTHALTPQDLVQANLTRTLARGYMSDPYKFLDQRPDGRNAWVALVRWNHHLEGRDAAIRSSYRYYTDSYGIRAHTVSLEWAQEAGAWTLTPGVRYHSQSAAGFYVPPVRTPDGLIDQGASMMAASSQVGAKSMDQRLSAYGAVTVSMKVAYRLNVNDSVDFKVERYLQRANWALGSSGGGVGPFNAWFAQVGWSHRF